MVHSIRKFFLVLMVISLVFGSQVTGALAASSSAVVATPPAIGTAPVAATDRIIIKFRSNVSAFKKSELIAKQKDKLLGRDVALDFHKIRLEGGQSLQQQLQAYRSDPSVEYAEPDYFVRTQYIPNDPSYKNQWHLPKMKVDQAWDISRGSSDVKIAIIDTGVDVDHPDLVGKLIAGYNSIDNSTNTNDDDGHGTHVAGIAAASTDNGVGTAGVCYQCKIMPVKALGAEGTGTVSDIAEGIRWAADNGAKVINMSLGSTSDSLTLQQAVKYANSKGCVLVAAAGNAGNSTPSYPAANQNVIAVAATDSSNNRATFSNFGSYVDLAAPGVSILATTNDGGYGYLQGTSMASPSVAGVAALLLSVNPALTPAQVETLLKTNAADLGTSGRDDYYGDGLVNAQAALASLSDTTPPSAPGNLTAITRPTSVSLSWTSSTDNLGIASYEVFRGTTLSNLVSVGSTTSTGFSQIGLTTGQTYVYAVKAKDDRGNVSAASDVSVQTQASTTPYTHTITLDKLNDFNTLANPQGNETFTTTTVGFNSHVTWDATNVYLGYSGADLASTSTDASSKWVVFYFAGAGGTTTGVTYNTQTPKLPFPAKYHIRYKMDGTYFNRMVYTNGAWTDAGNYPFSSVELSGSGYVEMRIPRADIGSPLQLKMVSSMLSEKPSSEWTWAGNPSSAFVADGYDRDLGTFHEFDLGSSVAAVPQNSFYGLRRVFNGLATLEVSFVQAIGATKVGIQQSLNGGLSWTDSTTQTTLNSFSSSATITGLTANTPYKFRLVATGGEREGSSAVLSDDLFADVTPPSAPSNLRVPDKSANSLRLEWDAATDDVQVNDYLIYLNGTQVASALASPYWITGLQPQTTYSVTIKARDSAGNVSANGGPLSVATSALLTGYKHTIALDGSNDFYNSSNPESFKNETFSTSVSDMYSYVTWDDENIYFGYLSSDITGTTVNASQKWILVYVGGKGGTRLGVDYSGQAPNLPFEAKYHLRFKVDGSYTNRQVWNGTAWENAGSYSWGINQARNDGNQFVEFKIPRAHFGMDTAKTMQWVSTLAYEDPTGNSDSMWASVPSDAFMLGNGYDRDFQSFYEFDLNSNNASAAQVYKYGFALHGVDPYFVNLRYSSSPLATEEYVEQSSDEGVTWTRSDISNASVNGVTYKIVKSVTPNQAYKFRFRVVGGNNAGTSSVVSVFVPADTVPPATPLKPLAKVIEANRIQLEVGLAFYDEYVSGYQVFQGATMVASGSGPFFDVTGLQEYGEYTFTVKAVDRSGNISLAGPALTVRTKDVTSPVPPTLLEYSQVTKSGFTLTWSGAADGGSGIKEYQVYQNGSLVTTVATSVSSYTFTGLAEYSSHLLRVVAIDQSGNVSLPSNGLSARTLDETSPSVPAGLVAADLTGSSFSLSWSASTDNAAVTGYRVYLNGQSVQTTAAGETQVVLTGLSSGQTYSVQVAAFDARNNQSALSGAISVKLPDTAAPTVPSGLIASNVTTSGFKLTWAASTDNVAVSGYNVYRNGLFVTSVTSTSYTFSGLTANTTYSITVMAYDAAKNRSAQSAALSVKTLSIASVDTTAPTVPSGLVASSVTTSGFKLTWNASTDNVGVTGYNVYRNGSYVASVTSASYTFSGLAANTTYSITVLAYDAAKNRSALSTALSVKTASGTADSTAPTTPTGLVASNVTTSGFKLSWNVSSDNVGVAGYNVYRNGSYVASVVGTSYTFSGLTTNMTYSITVLAYDAAKNRSALSTPLAVKTN